MAGTAQRDNAEDAGRYTWKRSHRQQLVLLLPAERKVSASPPALPARAQFALCVAESASLCAADAVCLVGPSDFRLPWTRMARTERLTRRR